MIIRDETTDDIVAVQGLITDAFAGKPYSDGTEPRIMDALREQGAAVITLVAEEAGTIVGQIAFSRVAIDGRPSRWHALGPMAVDPSRQRQGIGSALIAQGLERLGRLGSHGCVLLGDPAYYSRFGFRRDERLTAPGLPAEYFVILPFTDRVPAGSVAFHPAFAVAQ